MDSMVVILEAINVSTTMQFGPTTYAYNVFAISANQFYLNTMEAYYTGMMDLPIINGASEGALSVGLFLVFSAIKGTTIQILRSKLVGHSSTFLL